MKKSRIEVEENRRTVLESAGRLFRDRGFDPVTVSDVMKAAGLTHGAFYGYFDSKDDLIAAAIANLSAGPRTPASWSDSVTTYLSPAHREDRAGGCPVAALGPETARQAPPAQAAMTEAVRQMVARLEAAAPGHDASERRRKAVAACSAMVGALILSRAVNEPKLAKELLASTAKILIDTCAAVETP